MKTTTANSFPIYILEFGDKKIIVSQEAKVDITHKEFWKKTVAKIVAFHYKIPLSTIIDSPYCQKRARVHKITSIIYCGEKLSKSLMGKIRKHLDMPELQLMFDEHETRLPSDVLDLMIAKYN